MSEVIRITGRIAFKKLKQGERAEGYPTFTIMTPTGADNFHLVQEFYNTVEDSEFWSYLDIIDDDVEPINPDEIEEDWKPVKKEDVQPKKPKKKKATKKKQVNK
jgi:hypothetical protein